MSAKAKLLVVDDNEMNRDTLRRQLERVGYEVATADDGLKALEMVDQQRFDLILLDVMMPGLTGIELLKILRNDHSATALPIIMATARDKSENMVEALSLGANDYVTKPLDLPVVLARIEAHLKMKDAAARAAAPAPAAPAPASPAKSSIEPGGTIAGKYRLETKIGSGAFGAVYRARHLALDNTVAVKVLQGNMMPTEEALKRFQREGISACRIQHPNAVAILDFGVSDDGVAYLVMELLNGEPLLEEIKAHAPLSPRRCAEILLPICDVLGDAHAANIVHRDIKPANIFLHQGRSGETVKVLDFGIAKLVDDGGAELTVEGTLVGTPAYMAPERLAGQPYDGRSDVYSVAVMLYEMLTGQPPFKSKDVMAVAMMQMTQAPKPLREIHPGVPPAVEAVVLEAMVKDPDLRMSPAGLAEKFAWAVGESSGHSRPAAAHDAASVSPFEAPTMTAPAPPRRAAPRTPAPPPSKPAEEPRSWWQRLFGR
jgi:serine/threonine protein kinase/CheY-like chemotaxis protein